MSIMIFRPVRGTQDHRVSPHQFGDEQLHSSVAAVTAER
jgi:hypothetical protein